MPLGDAERAEAAGFEFAAEHRPGQRRVALLFNPRKEVVGDGANDVLVEAFAGAETQT